MNVRDNVAFGLDFSNQPHLSRDERRARVEDAVAEQMLDGQLKSGDTAHVRLKDDKVVIEK